MNLSDEVNNETNNELKFFCIKCNYSTNIKNSWKLHLKAIKHQYNMTHETPQKPVEYYCECCNVHINHMNNWIKHINTEKHKREGKPKSIECIECNCKFINHITQHHHNILNKSFNPNHILPLTSNTTITLLLL